MTDIMKVAAERRMELTRQVSELDEFIQMAQILLKQKVVPMVPSIDEDAIEDEEFDAAAEAEPEAEPEPEAEAEPGPDEQSGKREAMLANAPWKNMMPLRQRAAGDDSAGPTRVNLFRREVPAAG